MNVKDLEIKLNRLKVPIRFYCLGDEEKEDAHCLRKITNGWEVYCLERGEEILKVFFNYEFQACSYLYGVVINRLEESYGATLTIDF